MTSLFLTLLAPVLVLWIGACVFLVLDQWVRPQDAGVAEALVLVLAIGALLWGARLPSTDGPLPAADAPYAELAFGQALVAAGWPGLPPALRMDAQTRVLALALLGIAAAAALASLAESGLLPLDILALRVRHGQARFLDPRVAGRASRLAALGTALLVLFAGDWATLALAWVACDLFFLYARLAVQSGEGERWAETRWTLVLSLVGVICLGWLAIVHPGEGEPPSALAAGLALAAIVLRLLPWPLPAWPLASARRHALWPRVFAFLVPTLLGAHLCSQLAPWVWSAEWVESGRWVAVIRGPLLATWAAVALLVSAFKAWSAREPGDLIACTTLYGVGLIAMGCALNLPPSWLLLAGVGIVLNVCALSVSWTMCPYLDAGDPRTWWRVAPVGVALLSLSGLPLTVGFPLQASLYSGLLAAGYWWALLLLIAAQAGVLAALLRVLLEVECVLPAIEDFMDEIPTAPHRRDWQRGLAYGAGAALALGILALGILPSLLRAPGLGRWFSVLPLAGWAALLLPVAGALLLYREQERITAWMEDWAPVIERLLDLRWLYRGIERALQVLGAVIWNGSLVIEGAGYLAWVTLFGLVMLLLVLATR